MSKKKMKIKCLLEKAMKEKNISQAELERRTGIHHITIKKHREGIANRIDYSTLLGYCTVLDKTPGDLLVIVDEK